MQTMRWSKKMSFVLVFICCTQDASFGSVQVYLCRIMQNVFFLQCISMHRNVFFFFKFATSSRCIKNVMHVLTMHPNVWFANLQLYPIAKMYCSVLTPHCNASKAGKRKTSTCNGVKMAQQECELFQTSFFRMRGVVGTS